MRSLFFLFYLGMVRKGVRGLRWLYNLAPMCSQLKVELFGSIMRLFLNPRLSECILVAVGVKKSDGTYLSVY